jgi:hypothetical protein
MPLNRQFSPLASVGSMRDLVNQKELHPSLPGPDGVETAEKLTISRAGLARLAACSKPNITLRCRRELAPACVGSRVDLRHPAAVRYLERRGVRPEQLVAAVVQDRRLTSPSVDGFSAFVQQLRGVVAAPPGDRASGPEAAALLDAAAAFEAWARAREAAARC